MSAKNECENNNPCARKFYNVDNDIKMEELVDDYNFLSFLADSGGAMGKSQKNQLLFCFIIDKNK